MKESTKIIKEWSSTLVSSRLIISESKPSPLHQHDLGSTIFGLNVVEGGNTGEDLALEEFQRGSTSGRDVRHVTGAAGQLGGGDRVTSSNDGDGTLLLGQVGQDVDDAKGTGGELLEFKDAHGSVHNDSPGEEERKENVS
jgi:hypothetical protein